jgi:gliding motility-associated-like protein
MKRFLMNFLIKRLGAAFLFMLFSVMAIGQTASFTLDNVDGCSPLQVAATYTGSGATVWGWTINTVPPASSAVPNPVFTIVDPGTYTITLQVNGGVAVSSQQVIVYENPSPNFTASLFNGCAPVEICFTDQSIPGDAAITEWFWNLGVANIQTAQNPCVTYTENNNGITVQLVVEDANGCVGVTEKPNFITINKPPDPSFNVLVNSSCTVPFSPQISNSTIQNGEFTYAWSFPGADGNPTFDTYNPGTVVYSSNGNYDITLTTSDAGCERDTTVVGAVVIDELEADFTISDITPCQNESVTFTNSSNLGGLSYSWAVNGVPTGADGPVFTRSFTSIGAQTITLTVTTLDGLCTSTISKNITVLEGPTTDFTVDANSSCGIPFTANFTSITTGATDFLWTVNPGGQTSTNPNPSFTFTGLGNYTVSLTTSSGNGCTRTVTKNNFIRINSIVNMSIGTDPNSGQGCAPLGIELEVLGNIPPGVTISSVTWDLPGGSPNVASGQVVNTTYNAVGDYTATATINFSGGCSQTIATTVVEVGDLPNLTMQVLPTNICLNESVTGTATSDIPNTQFIWFFESINSPLDGGIGTTSSTPYTYEDQWQTPFEVFLVGISNGCSDTLQTLVNVNAPGATFEWKRSCEPKTEVTLTPDYPQGQFADFVQWEIVSGPGAGTILGTFDNINDAEITVDLGFLAIYEIKLTVSSSFTGCEDIRIRTIDLNTSVSNAIIGPRSLCPGETVSYRDNTPGIRFWQWIFGNGDTSEVVNVPTTFEAQFNETGNYQATLFTTNNANCRDTFYFDITVGGGFADIGGLLGACSPPLNTSFNTSPSVFPQGGVANANWLIDNGFGVLVPFNNTLSPGPFTYNGEGEYIVYLQAFDSIGCSDDTTVTILVGDVRASFVSDRTTICPGEVVQFNNLSLGGNLSYSWTFQGGNPVVTINSTDENPEVQFLNSGFYNVTLVVTDLDQGCSDDSTAIAYVEAQSSGLDFVADNRFATCPPLITQFSLVPPTNINDLQSITWYIEASNGTGIEILGDDSIQGISVNAPWIYSQGGPDDGFYDVRVVVTPLNGCPDQLFKNNYIFIGGPRGDFSFDPEIVCVPDIVTFTEINIQRTDSIIWDFGDGTSLTTADGVGSVTNGYQIPGIYFPKAILEKDGCTVVLNPEIPIKASNIRAGATVSDTFLCDGGLVLFNATSDLDSADITGDFIAQTIWDFGDGSSSTDLNPTHDYVNTFGEIEVNFFTSTDFGCSDDTTFFISIFETPNGIAGGDATICVGESVQLSASGASNYLWSPANFIVNPTSATPTVLPTDSTEFQVILYNDIQCPDTQYVDVNVLQRLEGIAGTSTQICRGESVQLSSELTVFPPNSNIIYEWFPPTALDDPSIANPISTPNSSITYTVTISSGDCETFSENVTIIVDGASFVNAGPDQIVVSGGSADLTAFSPGNFNFNWFDSQGNFLGNTPSINTGPVFETSTFEVQVGDNACRASDFVNVVILETCEDGIVTIPNVFSPNGDGINDVFRLETGLGVSSVGALKIFNRWGELVFQTEGVRDAWDGTQSGKALDPGVYVYSIEVICSNETKSLRKGNITLLK